MPRKKAPKARLSKGEKAALKAVEKASKSAGKDAKKAARHQMKMLLDEWCATPDAKFPRAD